MLVATPPGLMTWTRILKQLLDLVADTAATGWIWLLSGVVTGCGGLKWIFWFTLDIAAVTISP